MPTGMEHDQIRDGEGKALPFRLSVSFSFSLCVPMPTEHHVAFKEILHKFAVMCANSSMRVKFSRWLVRSGSVNVMSHIIILIQCVLTGLSSKPDDPIMPGVVLSMTFSINGW